MSTKKSAILSLFLLLSCIGYGQCLSDNFNIDYGNWTALDTYLNTTAGLSGNGVGFNTEDDQLTTTAPLTNPETISFWLKRSSSLSNRTLSIQYAETLTGSWTTQKDILVSDVTETHQEFTIPLQLTGLYYIRIIMTQRTAGSYYLDDVNIYCNITNSPELQLTDDNGENQNCGYLISFESIPVGSNTTEQFLIKNTGDIDLSISTINTSGEFSILDTSFPLDIPASSQQTFTIEFHPIAAQNIETSLSILNSDTDESTCLINLTAEAFIPEPEIDIERNTEASIPSGSVPNIGYNTIFASTAIGETSAKKLYYIHNEGTANLNINTIENSNPSEFQILSNPGNLTLTPDEKIAFEMQFAPTTTGERLTTISIPNSDSDENPYIFQIKGTGICSSTDMDVSPTSGPVGTTITAFGSDFGTETSAILNDISLTPNVISSTKIEFLIPENGTSGNLSITNDLGCSYSTNFNLISSTMTACEGHSGNSMSNLFISEVTKHTSGSHTYIEIFNGTENDVNLENYSIQIHNNGNSTPQHIINLSGIINKNDVFVLAIGGSDAEEELSEHGYDLASAITGINTNDNIRLFEGSNWIDLWGDTSGDDFTLVNKGYVYRRKNKDINLPSTTWNSSDWISFGNIDYTNIGTFDYSTGILPTITSQPDNSGITCKIKTNYNISAVEGLSGSSSLHFQWYFKAPESTAWEIASDNSNITGTSTSSLQILNTLALENYQFYCLVQEPNQNCAVASNVLAITLEKRSWNGSSWENNTKPTINSIILLEGDYTTSNHGNLSSCSLKIEKNSTLTVNAENYVSLLQDLYVEGKILVKNQGSFVQEDNASIVSNSGTITIEKETANLNAWYEYTYWSTPVGNETFDNTFKNSKRLFWFDASNFVDVYKEENNNNNLIPGQDDVDDNGDAWQRIQEGETITRNDNLQPGIGYAATHTNADFEAANNFTYTFTGDFNNGIIETPVYRNDESKADNNWNLIGNPYPSAISVDAFFDVNVYSASNPSQPLEGIIYLWSHETPPSKYNNGNEAYNFSQSDYAIINGSGSVAAQDGSGKKPTRFIPSCQGFFVKYSDAHSESNAVVKFNNAMRVTAENTQFFRNENTNRIWLNLTTENGIFSQTLIAYLPEATNDFDGSYFDAKTMISKSLPAKLFSTISDIEAPFVIQGRSFSRLTDSEVIPLGFYSSIQKSTLFKISLDDFEGSFFNQQNIILKDNLLNTYHDLKQSAYAFTTEKGLYKNRFEVVFSNSTLSTDDLQHQTEIQFIKIDTEWILLQSNAAQFKTMEFYDFRGRLIYQFKDLLSGSIINISKLNSAPFLVKATLKNGSSLTQKVILH
ncbi:choice-of-anchor D domain-containing protein [Formosa sp. S-31]|uniref:choice-of-anchor D domain-containing protein n=1 Tax=Formosa sp. S-31 TaxID=2790949 RepID=UPI003EC115EB